jgi:hypothetical protein
VTETEVVSVPYLFFPGQRTLYLIGTLVFIGVNLSLLLLGGLLLRSRLERIVAPLTRRPLLTLVAGLGLLVLFGLLEDTVSNFSFEEVLTSVMAMILCLLLLAGYSAVSWRLGTLIAPGKSQWVILLAGAAVTTLLLIIPVAGLFAAAVFPILSIGCVFLSGLGSDPDWFVTRIVRRRSGLASF